MPTVLPGTTLARSAALARAIPYAGLGITWTSDSAWVEWDRPWRCRWTCHVCGYRYRHPDPVRAIRDHFERRHAA